MKKHHSRRLRGLLLAAGIAASPLQAANPQPDPALLAKGAYLARAADCNACHRGATPGSADYSGGVAIATPMGDIIATNITPSKRSGIGNYSEADFKRAVGEGLRPDGEPLYPAMPYSAYQGISDEDMHALYVWFMHGVAPVDNQPRQTRLGFPWSVRSLMRLWNPLNARLAPPPAGANTPQLKRGYYLTEVLGHCSACHSPRNVMMGERMQQRYAGASLGGWYAPNITADPVSGIGTWCDKELKQYLRTGNVPGKASAAGGMAEAIDHSLRHLTDDDLDAMVAYLRQIPAVRNSADTVAAWAHPPKSHVSQADNAGEALYQRACATCHRSGGEGAYRAVFPPLTANSTTGRHSPDNLIMVILDGVEREGTFAPLTMPGFRDTLNDEQIAQLTNYVAHRFGNPAIQVSARDVATQRNGGAKPWLLVLLPWLSALAGVLVVLFIVQLIRRARRRKGV